MRIYIHATTSTSFLTKKSTTPTSS